MDGARRAGSSPEGNGAAGRGALVEGIMAVGHGEGESRLRRLAALSALAASSQRERREMEEGVRLCERMRGKKGLAHTISPSL